MQSVLSTPILRIFNHILQANEGSQLRLAHFYNKSFVLSIAGIKFAAVIAENGQLLPLDTAKLVDITALINIPLSVSEHLLDNDKFAMAQKITITGDTNFGRELLEIISNLQLSSIYHGVPSMAKIALMQIINLLSTFHQQLELMLHNTAHSAAEYLMYETTMLATKHEVSKFCSAVDELSINSDRLALKLSMLEQQEILK